MAKVTKKRKALSERHDFTKTYPLSEGIALIKATSITKFDSSVDIALNLNIDVKNPLQALRQGTLLPHGTGKVPIVLVICTPDKEAEAKKAGADHVGGDAYIEKIQKGWLEFDALVTMPSFMPKLGKLGKVLGPSGLMPNVKTDTVTLEIGRVVKEIKAGKVTIKTDKAGIVHSSVGRASFSATHLQENIQELIDTIQKARHQSVKGQYVKKISLSTTMGPNVTIDINSITNP